jgi:predicted metalloendopeptidase
LSVLGIRAAYRAFEKQKKQKEVFLNNRHYNQEQLFFMYHARFRCRKDMGDLANDPHAPAAYRIIGGMRNFPEFQVNFKNKKLILSFFRRPSIVQLNPQWSQKVDANFGNSKLPFRSKPKPI